MVAAKTLQVPITNGIRQDLSEHQAPPGTIMDALNVRFSAVGEVESRPGTRALSMATDANVTYSTMLTSDGPGVLARVPGGFVIGAQGYGYRYDQAKERLHVGGSYSNAEPLGVFETIAREDLAIGAVLEPYPLSQATTGGYVATVYSVGNGQGGYGPIAGTTSVVVHIRTLDGTLVTSVRLDSVSAATVVTQGPTEFALITQSATNAVSVRIITVSDSGATVGAPAAFVTLNSNTSHWAASGTPAGFGYVFAYQSGAALVDVGFYVGVSNFGSATFAVTGTVPLSVYGGAANVYVGWSEGGGPSAANARVYDYLFALTSGGTVALATDAGANQFGPPLFGPSTVAASAMYAFGYSVNPTIVDTTLTKVGILTAAGVNSIIQNVFQCTPISSPFANGYLWVRAGGIDNTGDARFYRHLLLDFMSLRSGDVAGSWPPVIALSRDLFLGFTATSYYAGYYQMHVAAPVQLAGGRGWLMGLPRVVREEDKLGVTGVGLALAEWVRFAIGGTRQVAQVNGEPLAAGSLAFLSTSVGTRYYDGSNLEDAVMRHGLDCGFPLPMAMDVLTSNSTGVLVDGVYQLRAVLERIDGNGRRWRSAPSGVSTVTIAGGNDTITVTGRANVDWLRAGYPYLHSSRFVMHVYRTAVNGSTFYRSTPPQGVPTDSGPGLFTFVDGVSDAVLTRREILYTDGGVLANDFPPACRFISATEDRVWLAGLWETEQLQSSKILVPGEPPQFSDSPAFRVVLPEPCTGVACQDGVVVAFTKRAIYAIQGGGPNDQGQGAWDSPRVISRSTGCITHQSILETSIGIFFQSEQGIELLPRGLGEPQFVGMAVQDFMYSTTQGAVALITSAAVVTTFRGRTARFAVDDGLGFKIILIFDLDTSAWSRDVYGAVVARIVDTDEGAALALAIENSGFGVLLETVSEDRDSTGSNPAEIASSLEWAELRPFGIAGYGRFGSALGLFDAKVSPSSGYRSGNATIKLAVDRQTEAGKTFNMATALAANDYERNVPHEATGTAGKLTLSTTVGGWRFVGWTVELEPNEGGRRVGETEQG